MEFNTIVREVTEITELIHLDVNRLLRFSSRKSTRLMLTVVDDYSRNTLVFVLRHNFDILIRIKQLKVVIKMKTGKTIKHV